ncbi:MAG: patatin-like phospholipase family protein [Chloroflexia bacterium]
MERQPTALISLVHEPLEALARLLGRKRRRRRVGLALSGGGGRGIAHIGVFSVLMEAGIIPDCVAGTSAGAAAGVLFCRGWSPEQMLRLVRGLSLLDLGRPRLRRLGLLDGTRFEELIRELVGDLTFADLSIPLAVVACDLLTGERVVLRQGALAPAVRASCSIPGIFTPVEMEGRLLVDGGLVDHLPVSVVREMGADYVIAVDVHPPLPPGRRPRNLFEVVIASYQIMTRNNTGPDGRPDCLIRPDTARFDWLRFGSQAEALFRAGRRAAQEALPGLLADLEPA